MIMQDWKEPYTLGVDLGGTKVNINLVDSLGKLVFGDKSLIPVSKEPYEIVDSIIAKIDACTKEIGFEAKAVGVGVAGQINHEGVVRNSSNLNWKNFPLRTNLESKTGLPVLVTNDVRAATWAEWHFGSGKGFNDLLVLFVGTGVGGCVISGGKIISGCNNSAGELGHTTLVFNGKKCHCPNLGCLEAYIGGWAIAERAKEHIKRFPEDGKCLISLAGSFENITAETVSKGYYQSEILSKQIVKETGQYLAAGIVSLVNAFNPCVIILGGGVIEGIPDLIKIVKDIVPTLALESAVEKLRIRKAEFGINSGAIGAAILAQKLLK
jgi:glucokinase